MRCRSSSAKPGGIYGRTRLLEGAYRAALALADSGLCLAHTMAQVLGGRYGLPQGAMNAICLPAALRFNEEVVPEAIARFGEALGTDDAPARVEELRGSRRIRPLAGASASRRRSSRTSQSRSSERPGAKANPRPASADEVAGLLRSLW